jgi:uncharacterized phiE125 gp8 family phage protein
MGLKLVTPPVNPVVTLAQAKAHLRVVDSDDDLLIAAMVSAATSAAQNFTGRAFVDQTWDLYLDEFPTGTDMFVKIPLPPLIEVVEVNYDDSAGNIQVVDPLDYYVDSASQPGWIVPTGTLQWPTPLAAINSVRVRFRAGYLDNNSPPADAVPDDIKAAVYLILGSLYENREEQITGTIANKLPYGSEMLLRDHRVLFGMA